MRISILVLTLFGPTWLTMRELSPSLEQAPWRATWNGERSPELSQKWREGGVLSVPFVLVVPKTSQLQTKMFFLHDNADILLSFWNREKEQREHNNIFTWLTRPLWRVTELSELTVPSPPYNFLPAFPIFLVFLVFISEPSYCFCKQKLELKQLVVQCLLLGVSLVAV